MKTSCGIVIINCHNQILGCVPHGKGVDTLIDIPKGGINEGETPLECALRETKEEAGLDMSSVSLTDLGVFDYNSNKKLHLFKCNYEIEDLSILRCDSNYYSYKRLKYFPEVISYEWVDFKDINNRFYKNLAPILQKII